MKDKFEYFLDLSDHAVLYLAERPFLLMVVTGLLLVPGVILFFSILFWLFEALGL